MATIATFSSNYEVFITGSSEIKCTCPRYARGLMCGHMESVFSRKPRIEYVLNTDINHFNLMRFPLFSEWVPQRLQATVEFNYVGASGHGPWWCMEASHLCTHLLDGYTLNYEITVGKTLYLPAVRDDVLLWSEATTNLIAQDIGILPCESFLHNAADDKIDVADLDLKGKCTYLWAWLQTGNCYRCCERSHAIKSGMRDNDAPF